jgi:hypothetical protein
VADVNTLVTVHPSNLVAADVDILLTLDPAALERADSFKIQSSGR